MKSALLLNRIAILFVPTLMLGASASPNAETESVATMNTEFAVVDLSLSKRATTKNCTITVKVTAKKKPLVIPFNNLISRKGIDITDRNGKPCPYTQYGDEKFSDGFSFENFSKRIPEGKSAEWTFPVEKYFALTPGKWYVEVYLSIYVLEVEREKHFSSAHVEKFEIDLPK